MQQFCETRLECRRKTFARFFGEAGDICPPCGSMCDNCIRSAAVTSRNTSNRDIANCDSTTHIPSGSSKKKHRPVSDSKYVNSSTANVYSDIDIDATSFMVDDGWIHTKAQESVDSNNCRQNKSTVVGKLQFTKASTLLRSKVDY